MTSASPKPNSIESPETQSNLTAESSTDEIFIVPGSYTRAVVQLEKPSIRFLFPPLLCAMTMIGASRTDLAN